MKGTPMSGNNPTPIPTMKKPRRARSSATLAGHKPAPIPTTVSHAQDLGHELLPAQANPQAMHQGVSLAAIEKKPGDLCHIGLCDPKLHTRVNYYLDQNLNCNVAMKQPC
jgi:hypothetical protein